MIPNCKKCDSNGDCIECIRIELDPKYNCLNMYKTKSMVPYK